MKILAKRFNTTRKDKIIKIPVGGYTPIRVSKVGSSVGTNAPDYWQAVRPLPYYSIFNRLWHAWNVLRYKADALYWTNGNYKKKTD